jgi:uncharacterized protein YuzB (UPF0349 family)
MDIVIEFCQSNYATGSDRVRDKLLDDQTLNADVIEYGCLGNCGQCYVQPYAIVNGDIVAVDEPDELIPAIYQHISKKQQEDEEWRKLGF